MPELPPDEMQARAKAFYERHKTRRSVRHFSDRPVPDGVVEDAIRAAGASPSGANLQPWHFAVVRDPKIKRCIRLAAEEEERSFYEERAPEEWLRAIAPMETDACKPFLETAPALVAVFMKNQVTGPDGKPQKTYYPKESVSIALGYFMAALHEAGLATLIHTPSPMGFLKSILQRPDGEKALFLMVVGYPVEGCTVPDLERLSLEEIASFH